MSYNIPEEDSQLTANEETIKRINDFKYLGSWLDDSAKDLKIRKAQAWSAALKLDNI